MLISCDSLTSRLNMASMYMYIYIYVYQSSWSRVNMCMSNNPTKLGIYLKIPYSIYFRLLFLYMYMLVSKYR